METRDLCECAGLARDDGWMFITDHHPNCKYFDPLGDTRALLGKLVAGIDAWASEEDGIHDAVYKYYTVAKLASGK